ncbi:cytochrome bc complex cytochrome b subunit, partial [Campylobacter coli]|nr:cytochrome bc complex cytochrome b subunit [Campylobacter coli]
PLFFIWFWVLLIDLIVLTIYGKLPPTGVNAWVGFYASIIFLLLFIVVLPVITIMERKGAKQ